MKYLLQIVFLLMFFSCADRKVKYSGLDDMFIGVEQIILYENGEFYLELGAGGTEGRYLIINDTINLHYKSKPSSDWPDQFIMTDTYFINVKSNDSINTIKISRQANKPD